jgi:aspartate-semialdehyde dehydrogenase
MNERAIGKQEAQVKDALLHGAKLLTGGKRHKAGPLFFEPTVLVDVPSHAAIFREETFGPVAALAPFDREDEVIKLANDSEYGLVAYVHTGSAQRAKRLIAALDYGMVAVNRTKITGAPVPFGGIKQSGLGREGSRAGMEAFMDIKYICEEAA